MAFMPSMIAVPKIFGVRQMVGYKIYIVTYTVLELELILCRTAINFELLLWCSQNQQFVIIKLNMLWFGKIQE